MLHRDGCGCITPGLADREGAGEVREVRAPPVFGLVRAPLVADAALAGELKQLAGVLRPQLRIFLQTREDQFIELARHRELRPL